MLDDEQARIDENRQFRMKTVAMEDEQMIAIAHAVNEAAVNRKFLNFMSNYLNSGNDVPVDRVSVKVMDLAKLIQLAEAGL
jgi:NAD kinase